MLTVLTWFYSAENMTAKPRAEKHCAPRKIEKAVLYFIHTDMVTVDSLTGKGELECRLMLDVAQPFYKLNR